MTFATLLCTSVLLILYALSGCSEYSNSTPWGSTVADDRTIEDVHMAIALLESKSPAKLEELSEKTSEREAPHARVRIKSKGLNDYEFFCWLPCQAQDVFRDVEAIARPELIRVTSEKPIGREVVEKWLVRSQGTQRQYQVRYFYVPGGGGPDPVFSRKPDHMHVRLIQ